MTTRCAHVLALLIVVCAVFGLAVGSFLNVVIYRVPHHESIVSPRSRCPVCHAPIRERDNIPVVSWLVLRGRCRDCGAAISPRYVLVELAGGALFAGLAARLGFNWDLPAYLALFSGLLALSCIDVEHLMLPKKVIYPTFLLVSVLLVLAAAVNDTWHLLVMAALYAVGWFVAFFLLNLASPRALGFGDVRLAPLLGLGLGWLGWRYVVLGFFAANLIGAVVGVALIASKRIDRRQPIPYGVFLAVGVAVAVFAGPEIVVHFHHYR
jgi:leader peptidase (prepilin peptidase)/N-methyltransferase